MSKEIQITINITEQTYRELQKEAKEANTTPEHILKLTGG